MNLKKQLRVFDFFATWWQFVLNYFPQLECTSNWTLAPSLLFENNLFDKKSSKYVRLNRTNWTWSTKLWSINGYLLCHKFQSDTFKKLNFWRFNYQTHFLRIFEQKLLRNSDFIIYNFWGLRKQLGKVWMYLLANLKQIIHCSLKSYLCLGFLGLFSFI